MIIDYVEISDSPTRSEVIFDFVFREAKKQLLSLQVIFQFSLRELSIVFQWPIELKNCLFLQNIKIQNYADIRKTIRFGETDTDRH